MRIWLNSFVVAVALMLGFTSLATAGEFIPYTAERLKTAQAEDDKPILVFVNANWCPTCAKQRKVLKRLINSDDLKDMNIFYIDFDVQRDAWRSFGATEQSTLIVFRGSKEVGRAVGITDEAEIKALLMKAKG